MNLKIFKLLSINILVLASMLLSLEAAARLFTRVTFFGNSRNLFDITDNSYYKNCRSCKAISAGVEVTLDSSGNRTFDDGLDPKLNSLKKTTSPSSDIVIIGDSVAFGPGIPFVDTFQNQLIERHPDINFINMSVIGHSLKQHQQTAEKIVNAYSIDSNNNRLQQVFLIYCLNDIQWSTSNANILPKNAQSSNSEKGQFQWVDLMKSNFIFSQINKNLRDKSKLYLFVKGEFTDPYKRYFLADLEPYRSSMFDARIKKLKLISQKFKNANIPFTIIIVPYEYQVRNVSSDSGVLLPQNRIKSYLATNAIDYIDLYKNFASAVDNSRSLYLGYDPMHLSEKGHSILSNVISKRLYSY